jgi:hypothetical protein
MRFLSEALISAGLVAAMVQFSSASAMMLTGRVQSNYTTGGASESAVQASNSQAYELQAQESAEQTASRFQGKWQCFTTVVDSNVPAVTPGTKVACALTFQALNNGQVKAAWEQKGWTTSESTVGKCANGALHLSHTNQFSSGWAAHAEAFARVTSPTTMVAHSVVDQYIDGRLISQYKTQSQLVKIDGPSRVAAFPNQYKGAVASSF